MSHWEPTSWEWETGRGIYLVDRYAPHYEARYIPDRLALYYVAVDARDEQGAMSWNTPEAAMQACQLHYELLATMTPSRASDHVARLGLQQASKRPTLRGLAPTVEMIAPSGVWS